MSYACSLTAVDETIATHAVLLASLTFYLGNPTNGLPQSWKRPIELRQAEMVAASITKTWDNQPVNHNPVNLTLTGRGNHVEFAIEAPFFNDPLPPCQAGPCDGLWNYEVVEAFFLAADEKYLEVEFGPHGQHLLLLLDGQRNIIAKELPCEYEVTSRVEGGTWTGVAKIPVDYFPPDVEEWNAYAIHADAQSPTGDGRMYESLFPVPQGMFPEPDFHNLDYFRPIKFEQLVPGNTGSEISDIWLDALGEPRRKKAQTEAQ